MIHLDDSTINEYLDSALPASRRAEVDSHLAACPQCAARLNDLRALFASIESLPDLPLEPDLSSSVVAAIQPKRATIAQPTLTPALRLAFAVQAILALIALAAAIPFAIQAIPTGAASQLTTAFSTELVDIVTDLSTQWIATIESLRTFPNPLTTQPPLPALPMVELSLCLAAVTVLWLVGNSVLLRPTSARAERR